MVSQDQDETHSLYILQSGFWENWHKLAKGMNSYQSQSSQLSTCGTWSKRKEKFHVVSSFPNSDCQAKRKSKNCPFGYTFVVDHFSPSDNYCFLACLILCPENLAWQPSSWRPQKYDHAEIWVVLHLQLDTAGQKCSLHPTSGSSPTDCYSSWGNGLSLSFGYLWE